MIEPKNSTNLKVKREHIDEFCQLIKNQIEYGGKKYAQGKDKEATDLICEGFGMEWRLGEMYKRLLRFKNIQKEYDMFKLAAECFLVWIQMGYHKNEEHDEDIDNYNKPKSKLI